MVFLVVKHVFRLWSVKGKFMVYLLEIGQSSRLNLVPIFPYVSWRIGHNLSEYLVLFLTLFLVLLSGDHYLF